MSSTPQPPHHRAPSVSPLRSIQAPPQNIDPRHDAKVRNLRAHSLVSNSPFNKYKLPHQHEQDVSSVSSSAPGSRIVSRADRVAPSPSHQRTLSTSSAFTPSHTRGSSASYLDSTPSPSQQPSSRFSSECHKSKLNITDGQLDIDPERIPSEQEFVNFQDVRAKYLAPRKSSTYKNLRTASYVSSSPFKSSGTSQQKPSPAQAEFPKKRTSPTRTQSTIIHRDLSTSTAPSSPTQLKPAPNRLAGLERTGSIQVDSNPLTKNEPAFTLAPTTSVHRKNSPVLSWKQLARRAHASPTSPDRHAPVSTRTPAPAPSDLQLPGTPTHQPSLTLHTDPLDQVQRECASSMFASTNSLSRAPSISTDAKTSVPSSHRESVTSAPRSLPPNSRRGPALDERLDPVQLYDEPVVPNKNQPEVSAAPPSSSHDMTLGGLDRLDDLMDQVLREASGVPEVDNSNKTQSRRSESLSLIDERSTMDVSLSSQLADVTEEEPAAQATFASSPPSLQPNNRSSHRNRPLPPLPPHANPELDDTRDASTPTGDKFEPSFAESTDRIEPSVTGSVELQEDDNDARGHSATTHCSKTSMSSLSSATGPPAWGFSGDEQPVGELASSQDGSSDRANTPRNQSPSSPPEPTHERKDKAPRISVGLGRLGLDIDLDTSATPSMHADSAPGQSYAEWLGSGSAPVTRTPSPSAIPQLRTPAEHADAIIARRRTKRGLPIKPRRSRSVGSLPRGFESPSLAKPSQEIAGSDEMEILADRSVPDSRNDLGHHDVEPAHNRVVYAEEGSRNQGTSQMASSRSSSVVPNREALKDRKVDCAEIPPSPKRNLPSSPASTVRPRQGPRKSDMNEYTQELAEYRNREDPRHATGKVFVRIDSFTPAGLPIPPQPTRFDLFLNNGLNEVKAAGGGTLVAGQSTVPIGQEFELLQHKNLQFNLTLRVIKDAHLQPQTMQVSVPASSQSPTGSAGRQTSYDHIRAPSLSPKKDKLISRIFGSPKKSKYASLTSLDRPSSPSPGPPVVRTIACPPEPLLGFINNEGDLARAHVPFEQRAHLMLGKAATFDLPMVGVANPPPSLSASLGHRRGHSAIGTSFDPVDGQDVFARHLAQSRGTLQVTMFFVPSVAGLQPLTPSRLSQCVDAMQSAKDECVAKYAGVLTQHGGDCGKAWRRRLVELRGGILVCLNEVTLTEVTRIDLSQAVSLEDSHDPLSSSALNSGSSDQDYEVFEVQNSFRLLLRGGDVLRFYADSDQDKEVWMTELRSALKRYGSGSHRMPTPDWARNTLTLLDEFEQDNVSLADILAPPRRPAGLESLAETSTSGFDQSISRSRIPTMDRSSSRRPPTSLRTGTPLAAGRVLDESTSYTSHGMSASSPDRPTTPSQSTRFTALPRLQGSPTRKPLPLTPTRHARTLSLFNPSTSETPPLSRAASVSPASNPKSILLNGNSGSSRLPISPTHHARSRVGAGSHRPRPNSYAVDQM